MKIAQFKVVVLSLITTVVMGGCEKAPIHDSIEQFWKLERFTVKETNEEVVCTNLFYSITRMVTEVSEKVVSNGSQDMPSPHEYGAFIARTAYSENGDSLILSDFKVNQYNTDSKVDATSDQLRPFGINNPQQTIFSIYLLSHKQLVLESSYARLELVRF